MPPEVVIERLNILVVILLPQVRSETERPRAIRSHKPDRGPLTPEETGSLPGEVSERQQGFGLPRELGHASPRPFDHDGCQKA